MEDLEQTYEFMKRYPLDNTQIYTLTPYPGTEIWEIAKSKRLASDHDANWARLRVQLKELTPVGILFNRWKDILKDKVCLSDSCHNPKYIKATFRLQKVAYLQNLRFYLKEAPKNLNLVRTVVRLKAKSVLNRLRHILTRS